MSTVLDPDVPLHHQIYLILKDEIADGLWVDRNDFPSESELANRFSVSVITSRRALTRLAEDGWIERSRGRRTKVVRQPDFASEQGISLYRFPKDGKRLYKYKLLEHGLDIGSAEACMAFNVPAGTHLWRCSRLRTHKGRLHSATVSVQSPEVGEKHKVKDLKSEPMVVMFKKAGIRPAKLLRRFSASRAPDWVARNLEIPAQTAVLLSSFVTRDADDKAIEWTRVYLHPDQVSPVEELDLDSGVLNY